jgi:hypothetical protein
MSAIHKLIESILIREELPDQSKQSTIVPIHIRSGMTECNDYLGITLLSTS